MRFKAEEKKGELRWELSKMEFLARLLGSKWRAPGPGGGQTIGEACAGKDLDKCRTAFGERLAEICATCPD